jgi:hypothetical protein
MAGTTIPAVKTALKTAISGLSAMTSSTPPVQVAYGEPGSTQRRECVYLGAAVDDSEHETTALRAGRRKRDETYVLKVHVEVIGTPNPETVETRAVALSTPIEEWVADNPKLTVDAVQFALVSGVTLDTQETTDGARTVVTIDVRVRARLQ